MKKETSNSKLSLNDLKLESFITGMNDDLRKIISGMNNHTEPVDRNWKTQIKSTPCYYCGNNNGGEGTYPGCVIDFFSELGT